MDTFPPTQIDTPSLSGSAIVSAGQTVKQFAQYMHRFSRISTESFPFTFLGRIAASGHDATRFGISHTRGRFAWSIFGGRRWIPRIAMSEQCTAPHMFRQHATAMRSFPGSRIRVNSSASSSITTFTSPDASVADEWQCTHPCVCTTLEIAFPIPPTR